MRFLVDAQLPARLARFLSSSGHDALHNALLALFAKHLDAIVEALNEGDFVELASDALVVHRRRGDEPPG